MYYMLLVIRKKYKHASAITIPIPIPPNVAINKKVRILAKSHFINEYAEDASIYTIFVYYL